MKISFWDMNSKIPKQYYFICDMEKLRIVEILTCIDEQNKYTEKKQ